MRLAIWVGLGWFVMGCCSNGRYPSDLKGGIHVRQDEFVDSWRVNGGKVCPKEIFAAPGCYVLEVEYSASYSKAKKGGLSPLGIMSPLVGVVEQEENRTRATYDSGRVPFALRLRQGNSYYVTATFTGDQFLPRIIESNAVGERLGQIDPVLDDKELDDCRAGRPAAPAPAKQGLAHSGYRVSWRLRNEAEHTTCD